MHRHCLTPWDHPGRMLKQTPAEAKFSSITDHQQRRPYVHKEITEFLATRYQAKIRGSHESGTQNLLIKDAPKSERHPGFPRG
ncbi:hypothetical protein Nepgr_023204 [Nepenthes gracilis]|uniref:Uncharacterized protein n=1 Tax=Nepenthes gracilis TaxID=150966 RepID=A0AAD3T3F0_NEPGR|nr:hypothetical protein Nepgr_023204 [Nepenthes gracilis]